MGNVCCGAEESRKRSALEEAPTDQESLAGGAAHSLFGAGERQTPASQNGGATIAPVKPSADGTAALSPDQRRRAEERRLAERREQARLEAVVAAAGRAMVATSRGNLPYYHDQGFAAALVRHLAQTARAEGAAAAVTAVPLPDFPRGEPVDARLAAHAEPPPGGLDEAALDRAAEAFLDETALVTKERLFAGVRPIVETLI